MIWFLCAALLCAGLAGGAAFGLWVALQRGVNEIAHLRGQVAALMGQRPGSTALAVAR